MHLMYASLGSYYRGLIDRKNNYLRWIEYAISATIMLIIVGISSGVKDLDSITLFVFALPAVMVIGNAVECSLAAGGPMSSSISATVGAWLMLIGIFVVMMRSFVAATKTAKEMGAKVPDFVPVVVIVTMFFFASFGIVQILQMCGFYKTRGGYPAVELSYITLSFVSKTLLALLVASGLVARSMPSGTGMESDEATKT
jgi:hypothetical protein